MFKAALIVTGVLPDTICSLFLTRTTYPQSPKLFRLVAEVMAETKSSDAGDGGLNESGPVRAQLHSFRFLMSCRAGQVFVRGRRGRKGPLARGFPVVPDEG